MASTIFQLKIWLCILLYVSCLRPKHIDTSGLKNTVDHRVVKILDGLTANRCAAYCTKHYPLASCTFRPRMGKTKSQCEITLTSDTFYLDDDDDYEDDDDNDSSENMQFDTGCEENPCMNGGSCLETESQEVECNCIPPTTGTFCEELNCGNSTVCTRVTGTSYVYYFYMDDSVRYDIAKSICEVNGYEMAMPKDRTTNNFLQQYLLEMYGYQFSYPYDLHAFYGGLRRATKDDPWIWDDGEPLGPYNNWRAERPQTDCCLVLNNGPNYNFTWDDDPCDLQLSDWEYFTICQKDYPFLNE